MKRIAIVQSNYIPWKGYFDLINAVDEFVLYDDMQYTRRDWRNRNKLKTPQGLKWITIPVDNKGKYYQKINETVVSDHDWATNHWKTVKQLYSKAEFFVNYEDIFSDLYLSCNDLHLSKINFRFISAINSILGIKTKISWSSDYVLEEGRTEKILGICRQAEADVYVSGPSAKTYFDVSLANNYGIHVEWMDYSGYPVYRQLYPPFDHGVSILDLIFNEGPSAMSFIQSVNK